MWPCNEEVQSHKGIGVQSGSTFSVNMSAIFPAFTEIFIVHISQTAIVIRLNLSMHSKNAIDLPTRISEEYFSIFQKQTMCLDHICWV